MLLYLTVETGESRAGEFVGTGTGISRQSTVEENGQAGGREEVSVHACVCVCACVHACML